MISDQRFEIARQLRCAAESLNVLIKMTESGQPCEEVLHQIYAVQLALRATGTRLIICRAQNSQAIILDSHSRKQRLSELKRLQSLYAILLQYSNHHGADIHD